MPGAALSTGNTVVNETNRISAFMGLVFQQETVTSKDGVVADNSDEENKG